MTLALLLHSLLQRKLRLRIKESGKKVPNQKNKPSPTPTTRWVNQKFEGIDVIEVVTENGVRYVYQAIGEFVNVVLDILGPEYVSRYTPSCLT
jgi:hypothetical protein